MSEKGLEHNRRRKNLVDEKLNFHRQTASAIKKAKRVLGLVKRTFINLDEKTLPLLFTSLVRSHLEYGNVICGPFSKGESTAQSNKNGSGTGSSAV